LLALSTLALPAQGQELRDRSARTSRYEMEVALEPITRTVDGVQRITWRNTTGVATGELWFHLYAFADRDSTLMQESDEAFRAMWRDDEFGGITLEELRLERSSGSVSLEFAFAQPDDRSVDDRRVIRAALPSPVAPGAAITLTTRFRSKLPKAYRRTGWLPGDGFFCMHWYPKLGVLIGVVVSVGFVLSARDPAVDIATSEGKEAPAIGTVPRPREGRGSAKAAASA
jgi:hypothetical protein